MTLLPPLKGFEAYSLNMTGRNWTLKSGYFPGMVRGVETFSQAFYDGGVDLPLVVSDEPDF
jgi:hypothetical protein